MQDVDVEAPFLTLWRKCIFIVKLLFILCYYLVYIYLLQCYLRSPSKVVPHLQAFLESVVARLGLLVHTLLFVVSVGCRSACWFLA